MCFTTEPWNEWFMSYWFINTICGNLVYWFSKSLYPSIILHFFLVTSCKLNVFLGSLQKPPIDFSSLIQKFIAQKCHCREAAFVSPIFPTRMNGGISKSVKHGDCSARGGWEWSCFCMYLSCLVHLCWEMVQFFTLWVLPVFFWANWHSEPDFFTLPNSLGIYENYRTKFSTSGNWCPNNRKWEIKNCSFVTCTKRFINIHQGGIQTLFWKM